MGLPNTGLHTRRLITKKEHLKTRDGNKTQFTPKQQGFDCVLQYRIAAGYKQPSIFSLVENKNWDLDKQQHKM